MSDMIDAYVAMRAERQARGQANHERAIEDFETARALAQKHGLSLVQYGEVHYALIRYVNGKALWRHHIHPGNRRIRADANMPTRAPYLKLPDDWGLLDVVRAAIEATND